MQEHLIPRLSGRLQCRLRSILHEFRVDFTVDITFLKVELRCDNSCNILTFTSIFIIQRNIRYSYFCEIHANHGIPLESTNRTFQFLLNCTEFSVTEFAILSVTTFSCFFSRSQRVDSCPNLQSFSQSLQTNQNNRKGTSVRKLCMSLHQFLN